MQSNGWSLARMLLSDAAKPFDTSGKSGALAHHRAICRTSMALIAHSIMNAARMLGADKTIKYDLAKAVLGIRIGDNLKRSADDFAKLAAAFFR